MRKSLNAIASSVWWFVSGAREDQLVMSERTAERKDVLMMDSLWMCWRREEGKHEETKMQEYILTVPIHACLLGACCHLCEEVTATS